MTYRDLLDEQNRLPLSKSDTAFNTDSALNNPHLLAVTASEYKKGPSKNSLENANPNKFGLRFLAYISTTDFNLIFESDSRITSQQKQKYINYLTKQIVK